MGVVVACNKYYKSISFQHCTISRFAEEFVLQTAITDQRQRQCPPSAERSYSDVDRNRTNFSLNFGGTPGITKRLVNRDEK